MDTFKPTNPVRACGTPGSCSAHWVGESWLCLPHLTFCSCLLAASPERPRPAGTASLDGVHAGMVLPEGLCCPSPCHSAAFSWSCVLQTSGGPLPSASSPLASQQGKPTDFSVGQGWMTSLSPAPSALRKRASLSAPCPCAQEGGTCTSAPQISSGSGRPSASLCGAVAPAARASAAPLHATASSGSLKLPPFSLSHPALTPAAESLPGALGGQSRTRVGQPWKRPRIAFEDRPRLLSPPCPGEPEAPEDHPPSLWGGGEDQPHLIWVLHSHARGSSRAEQRPSLASRDSPFRMRKAPAELHSHAQNTPVHPEQDSLCLSPPPFKGPQGVLSRSQAGSLETQVQPTFALGSAQLLPL